MALWIDQYTCLKNNSVGEKEMNAPEIFTLSMPQLEKSRIIRVWTPSDYQSRLDKHYPVLYMHDGQNLFDRETAAYGEIWDVHTAIEALMENGDFGGAIVVGIDNAPGLERLDEYSPWITERIDDLKELGEYERDFGGQGIEYGQFLVDTLKPYIDSHYRSLPDRENTGVAGSSMGGFISLYLGVAYPEIYSKIGAFSTAVWFADKALFKHVSKLNPNYKTRWYLDIGTEETSNKNIEGFNALYVDGTLAVEKKLLELGVLRKDVKVVIEEGATHFETAWARRFPEALRWLFENSF